LELELSSRGIRATNQVMKMLKGYGQKLENTTSNHEAKFRELKDLISRLASLSTKFYPAETITTSNASNQQVNHGGEYTAKTCWTLEGSEGTMFIRYINLNEISIILMVINDVHKCLYKCNQYFEMEEIDDSDKVKPISYVLLGR
jgi:hypothetical protein